MTLPNFALIGVPKAGTSSLQDYLSQHPQVYVAWEPRFLQYAGQTIHPGLVDRRPFPVTSLAEYEAIFAGVADRPALVDSSPAYLMYPDPSIAGIRKFIPDAGFIAIFRHPADRGYSEYVMQVSHGQEPCRDYAEAIRKEEAGRKRDNGQWRQYFRRGYYSAPTRKFLEAFPRERFLFLLYDDLVRNPKSLLRTIFQFLDVDPEFIPDMEKRSKVGRWPRRFRLHQLINSQRSLARRLLPKAIHRQLKLRVNARNLSRAPALDPLLRRELTAKYREDILVLQDLIGRDLSEWLAD